MKKILLTSAGFENPAIQSKFMDLVAKKPEEIKALFIITAAIEPDAILILPKCLEDLLNCKIPSKNITVYDMHKRIDSNELIKYDVVYVCGGKTSYLVDRINEVGFKEIIEKYIENGGIYIGVSAGSIAASGNFPLGLNFLKNNLTVHCEHGSDNGKIEDTNDINLTNNQAILITEEEAIIFE